MPTLYELNEQTKQLLNLLTDGEIDEQTYNDTLEGMGLKTIQWDVEPNDTDGIPLAMPFR